MFYNTLSVDRSKQYQSIVKQWDSEIRFFAIETSFLQNLLNGCIPLLPDTTFTKRRAMTVQRLLKLEEDKNYSDHILNQQCETLEQVFSNQLLKNEVEIACRQLELEFLMTSLNEEYREVKKELFSLVESALTDNDPT